MSQSTSSKRGPPATAEEEGKASKRARRSEEEPEEEKEEENPWTEKLAGPGSRFEHTGAFPEWGLLMAALSKNTTLKHFELRGCDIGVEGADELSTALGGNDGLETLIVRDCGFECAGVFNLMSIAAELKVSTLDLSYNTIDDDSEVFGDIRWRIKDGHPFKVLRLAGIGQMDEHLYRGLDELMTKPLQTLDLSDNGITQSTGVEICGMAVRETCQLKRLILDRNPKLGDGCIDECVGVLCDEKCTLTELSLRNCRLQPYDLVHLVKLAAMSTDIQVVAVDDDDDEDAGEDIERLRKKLAACLQVNVAAALSRPE